MAVYIAQASHDENGKYVGGQPGNQSGTELNTMEYYSSSSNQWNVYRAKDGGIANGIASSARGGVANMKIGYAQDTRNTIREQQKLVNWILANIKNACNCDCTSFDASCINEASNGASDAALFAGGNLMYTGNAHAKILATGLFDYIGKGIAESDLYTGDILVRDGHAVVVIQGKSRGGSTTSSGTSFADATIEEIAKAVIAGRYGNGADRKAALGDKYDAVQAEVNKMLYGTANAAGTSTGTTRIIAGSYKVVASSLYVRSEPKKSDSTIVYQNGKPVTYSYGQVINSIAADVVEADGYVWAHYTGYSGATRYVAVGTADGSEKYLVKC